MERNCASGLKVDKQHCKYHVTQIIIILKKASKTPSRSPENIQEFVFSKSIWVLNDKEKYVPNVAS